MNDNEFKTFSLEEKLSNLHNGFFNGLAMGLDPLGIVISATTKYKTFGMDGWNNTLRRKNANNINPDSAIFYSGKASGLAIGLGLNYFLYLQAGFLVINMMEYNFAKYENKKGEN